jgi:glycosidase
MLVPPMYFPEWFETVRNVRSDLFIFAETYDYNRPENYKSYLEAGFNGTLNFYLQGAFKETFAYGNSTNVIAENMKNTIEDLGLEQTQLMVNFIDNHDITRFMTHDRGETGLITEDVRRHQLALTSLLTLPGIPQIYYGNEIGALGSYPNNRRDMPEWVWDETARRGNHPNFLSDADKTFELTKKLISIRKSNPALTKGSYFEIVRQGSDSNPNIYIFLREFEQYKILVIINNDESPMENYNIDLKQTEIINSGLNQNLMNCEMKDLLKFGAPASLEISNGEFAFDMKSKSAGIYLILN